MSVPPDTNTEKMPSTSDERAAISAYPDNNTMRHQYRVLTDAEKGHMVALKDHGLVFLNLCDSLGSSRELSLAKTKMEEAVFWAVKHLTK